MSSIRLARRRFLALSAAGLGGSLLSGCDRLSETPEFQEFLSSTEELNYRIQRLLGGRHALAREFTARDVSPVFKVNGSRMPEARTMRPCWKTTSPIGACASTGWSPIPWTCRLRSC